MSKTINVRYHSFPLSDAATLRQAKEILSLFYLEDCLNNLLIFSPFIPIS